LGLYDVPFYVLPTTGAPIEVFTLGINFNATGFVSFVNNSIIGRIASIQVQLSLESSNVGKFDPTILGSLLNEALVAVVIPSVNKYLASSPFPFISIPNVKLVNLYFGYGTGYIMASLNVAYAA